MEVYTYSISGDFPNGTVDPGKLTYEIESSDIEQNLEYINSNVSTEDNCDIAFTKALSGTDETTLDDIVATHDGIPFQSIRTITVERIDSFTSTASGYTEVLCLSASNISPGEYRLLWSIIYGIDSGTTNFRMRVRQNDEVTKAEHVEEVPNADPEERIPRSGFIPTIITTPGDYHWDIECGKEQSGEEAWKIFKAFLELRRLD